MVGMRRFAASDIWKIRQVSEPELSPDGNWVAFVVATPDRRSDEQSTSIWVSSVDGAGSARPFTSGPRDTTPRWSPDGKSLAFVGDRGDEPQLYLAPLSGGEPRAITSMPFGVSAPAWSPDSHRLAFVARTGEWKKLKDRSAIERSAPMVTADLYNRFDNVGRFDVRRSHVFVIEAGGGEPLQLSDGDWDDAEPTWAPDGSEIAFTSDRSATRGEVPRRDLWVISADSSGEPCRLTRGVGTAVGPQFSPDGTLISYVGHENPVGNSSRNTHLMVVPKDGSGPPISLSRELDRTVAGVLPSYGRSHAWSRASDEVYFLANDRGTQGIYGVDVILQGSLPKLLLGGNRQVMALSASCDTLTFVSIWPSTFPELCWVRIDGSGERELTSLNSEISSAVELVPLERVGHRSTDGLTIDSYILYPPGLISGQPAPTVLEIHGGPHSSHPQSSMMPLYQALAGEGYVVVLPNPRGSHGYGEEFAASCVEDWGGADFDDLMTALDFLVEQGTSDPAKLYVAGYSYGGFMTTWAVGHTSRFCAAAVSAPVSNLSSMFGTTDVPFFNEFEAGGSPWERPEYYAAHSPVTHLPHVDTAVLVLHWDGDLRCPIGQGEEVFQGLRKLGKEAVMVRYPGGFHVSRTPSQMEDYVLRHLDWFASH